MRRCQAGIIVVSADESSKNPSGKYAINENVLIEIGAAFVLYDRLQKKEPVRFALVDRGVRVVCMQITHEALSAYSRLGKLGEEVMVRRLGPDGAAGVYIMRSLTVMLKASPEIESAVRRHETLTRMLAAFIAELASEGDPEQVMTSRFIQQTAKAILDLKEPKVQ